MMYKYAIVVYFILDLYTSSLELLESGKKKYTSAKGGSKIVDWSKGKWEKINNLFDKFFQN